MGSFYGRDCWCHETRALPELMETLLNYRIHMRSCVVCIVQQWSKPWCGQPFYSLRRQLQYEADRLRTDSKECVEECGDLTECEVCLGLTDADSKMMAHSTARFGPGMQGLRLWFRSGELRNSDRFTH